MLTLEAFDERVEALWQSQKRMAAPRKFKSGRRAGTVRTAGMPIQFERSDLRRWLWKQVGLNAVPCPYCRTPIDIVSLTLDHIIPRSLGGEFSLANMQVICRECNERKSNMTAEGFTNLLEFAQIRLSAYDRDVLLGRLKAAHHGSPARFFRPRKDATPALPAPSGRPSLAVPVAKQKSLDWF